MLKVNPSPYPLYPICKSVVVWLRNFTPNPLFILWYLLSMKYIITETRLKQLIFKFLDYQNLSRKKVNDDIFFLKDKYSNVGVLRYDTTDGWLFILGSFADNVSSMFGITKEETESFISSWVESVLKTKVSNPDVWEGQTAFTVPK